MDFAYDPQIAVEVADNAEAIWRAFMSGDMANMVLNFSYADLIKHIELQPSLVNVAGHRLGELRKDLNLCRYAKEARYSFLYHEYTDQCLGNKPVRVKTQDGSLQERDKASKGSSKYDKEYRQHRVYADDQYRQLVEKEAELLKQITTTEAIMKSLDQKHSLMLTMMKNMEKE